MMRWSVPVAMTAAVFFGMAASAEAQTEIQWWHALSGANTEVVENLAKDFNATQKDYKVVPVYKGTYPETLNAGIAAFRARRPDVVMHVVDRTTQRRSKEISTGLGATCSG